MSERLFPSDLTAEFLNSFSKGLTRHLGIEYIEIGPDYLTARMPVDDRTRQPYGILHGGASVVLAESLGSVAAHIVAGGNKATVGLEVNANHIRAVREGFVIGTVTPLHIGGRTQVWEIKIRSEDGRLVCVSRLTVAVLDAPPGKQ